VATLRPNNCGDPVGNVNAITLATPTSTTATWPAAPLNMPTVVSPNILKLIVEPNSTHEEIMYVTAYTAGAISATVTRAQEGSTGIAHSAVNWVCGPTSADFNLGGDVSGDIAAATVTQIQGHGVWNNAPTAQSYLMGDGNGNWGPYNLSGGDVSIGSRGSPGGNYAFAVNNVTNFRGYSVDPASPGGGSVMQLVAYQGTGTWVWAPVTLGGDIIFATQPTGANTPSGFQVRGLYGQAMTGPLGNGSTFRFNGTNLVSSAMAGNIGNDAMFMNNPAANYTAPTGFSVIGNMGSSQFNLNAGIVYLLIATVTVEGPQGTIVEIGFGSSTAFGISGWACNAYLHLPQSNYNVNATCWGFIAAGNAASTVHLCINTNGPNVVVVRNGINYSSVALQVALSYGNS
jgi:hypothetical protein